MKTVIVTGILAEEIENAVSPYDEPDETTNRGGRVHSKLWPLAQRRDVPP